MRFIGEDEMEDYREQMNIERWERKRLRRLSYQAVREFDPSERHGHDDEEVEQ